MDREKSKPLSKVADHMANERTFLAWIRTSIGIMAFGFVVEKFSLFLKQLGIVFVKSAIPMDVSERLQGHSAILGIILLGFGTIICLLAFFKYKKAEYEINLDSYKPGLLLDLMLTLLVFCVGVFLTIYLVHNL